MIKFLSLEICIYIFQISFLKSLSRQNLTKVIPVKILFYCNASDPCILYISCRELSCEAILQALRDETMNDPRERIEMAQSHAFYRPTLLGQ